MLWGVVICWCVWDYFELIAVLFKVWGRCGESVGVFKGAANKKHVRNRKRREFFMLCFLSITLMLPHLNRLLVVFLHKFVCYVLFVVDNWCVDSLMRNTISEKSILRRLIVERRQCLRWASAISSSSPPEFLTIKLIKICAWPLIK